MTSFTTNSANKMVQKFQLFLNDLHEFRRIHIAHGPAVHSLAASEKALFADPERLMTVYSQGIVLLELTEDHAESFIRCVAEPALSFAVWTNVRTVLESSALAAWLLDEHISVKERVQRSLAFRYEGLEQQRKLLNSIGRHKERDGLMQRIDSIEQSAVSLGYSSVVDKNQKRIGIGQVMPPITEIIRDVLDEETTYRILSGVAHGHSWALTQLGMQVLDTQNCTAWDAIDANTKSVQKHLRPEGVGYLCAIVATAYTKALWHTAHLFDWNPNHLEGILERNFDRMNLTEAVRHWRK